MSQRVRHLFAARARHRGAGATLAGRPRAARGRMRDRRTSSCRSPARSSAATPGATSSAPAALWSLGVDGLGHGLGAAQAATEACEVFTTEKTRRRLRVLRAFHTRPAHDARRRCHRAGNRLGRGPAARRRHRQLVAAIDRRHRRRNGSPPYNGIVGHATPRIRELSYPSRADGDGGISFRRADHQLAARTLSGTDATPRGTDRRSAVS